MQVQPLLVRQQSFARLSVKDMSSSGGFFINELHDVGVKTGPYDIGPVRSFLAPST